MLAEWDLTAGVRNRIVPSGRVNVVFLVQKLSQMLILHLPIAMDIGLTPDGLRLRDTTLTAFTPMMDLLASGTMKLSIGPRRDARNMMRNIQGSR